MEKINNKKIIAVSGGVDSMFLLNKFKHENIVVAHVNYNIRHDVEIDLEIITNFCKKHNLKLEVLNLKETHYGNFHDWARNQRYDFFKTIYKKYKSNQLIIAHHKDDFLETAIMQWRSKRIPYYFGISKNNNNFEMNIHRPMIFQYWKNEIYKETKNLQIPFNDDWTNFTNKYTRNEIRNELNETPTIIKNLLFNCFQFVNLQKCIKNIEIIKKYIEWNDSLFNLDYFKKNQDFSNDLIFKFLIDKFEKININYNVLNSIKQFLMAKNGNKEFLLSNNKKLIKFNNNLAIK